MLCSYTLYLFLSNFRILFYCRYLVVVLVFFMTLCYLWYTGILYDLWYTGILYDTLLLVGKTLCYLWVKLLLNYYDTNIKLLILYC